MRGRTFRLIMLTAAWLVGVYLVYWAFAGIPGQPQHHVLYTGCGLLLLSLVETLNLMRQRGQLFTVIMPLALIAAAVIVATDHETAVAEGILDQQDDAGTVTVIRDTLDPSLLRPRTTRPKPPYHTPDETVALNLVELHRLAANEWNARQPGFSDSPTHIGLKNFGTDRIRVAGRWTTEHSLDLGPNEGILAMMHRVSDWNPYQPTGFLLRFPSKQAFAQMKVNTWYEITGRLAVDPNLGTFPYQEMDKRLQAKAVWLEVDSVRVIERPSEEEGMLMRASLTPPHFPVPVTYKETP